MTRLFFGLSLLACALLYGCEQEYAQRTGQSVDLTPMVSRNAPSATPDATSW